MKADKIEHTRWSIAWGRLPSMKPEEWENISEHLRASIRSDRYPWGDKPRQPITVDHIFYDDVATVVFWTDGTKTVVKCAEGTPYDEYSAFCIALAKKIYGNNSALKRAIKNHARYSKKRQIIKTLCGETSKDVKHGDTFVITNEENKND